MDDYDQEDLSPEDQKLIAADAAAGKTVSDILVEEILALVQLGYDHGLTDSDLGVVLKRVVKHVGEKIIERDRPKFKILKKLR